MSQDKRDPQLDRLEQAKIEAERAKKRLTSTMGALQYRLKPATLASDAWHGVKEKSGALADDALQAVKDRPVTASGILAALVIFLARDPLWEAISGFFRGEEDQDHLVVTRIDRDDENYDLAAPAVSKKLNEGVNA